MGIFYRQPPRPVAKLAPAPPKLELTVCAHRSEQPVDSRDAQGQRQVCPRLWKYECGLHGGECRMQETQAGLRCCKDCLDHSARLAKPDGTV